MSNRTDNPLWGDSFGETDYAMGVDHVKQRWIRMLSVVLVLLLIPAMVVSAANLYSNGDANGDGIVNLKDVTQLKRMLAAGDVDMSMVEGNPDTNGDGTANMKDITLLQRYLAGGWGVTLPELETEEPGLSNDLVHYELLSASENQSGIVSASFRYGTSVRGRDLVCWSIHPESFSRTVLLNFEIHGWEDEYAADGQLLIDLGNALAEHYSQSMDMHDCRLLIVPSANPDGVAEGVSNNGFGRCNADGVDLNRDFDANHKVCTTSRNYTLYPFSAPESQALRDLVWASDPDVVVDFHGWLDYTIGDSELAEVFSVHTGLNHKYELGTGATGYFSYWAQLQGAQAILVEFTNSGSIVTEDIIAAVDRLIANNYGRNQYDYELDADFADFDSIITYARTSGKIYTQQKVGDTGTSYGYIDGAADECTVLQIYSNGWCKVNYPVGSLTKTGYCELSAFIDPSGAVSPYSANTNATVKVYTTSSLTTQLGSVWSTDALTVVAEEGGAAQIIYPLDDGGYKMGWINLSTIIKK